MSEFFFDYGLFLLKALTFLVAIVATIFLTTVLIKATSGGSSRNRVRFFSMNDEKLDLQEAFATDTDDEQALKALKKTIKASSEKASASAPSAPDVRVFVIDFDGDKEAQSEGHLEQEVEAILSIARPESDQVVVKLKSSGGYVHSYGIAAEHLVRLKESGLKLTVCVDEIAASGGYMMACVADKVIAAPFSIIGSVGVVAGVPNVNNLLTKHGVDYEDFTAGEYKRTVSTMGKITKEGREKFQKDLEATHEAFKDHVKAHRPDLDVSDIATGESWLGRQALAKGLVDEIGTSGRLIASLMSQHDVFEVRYKRKKELSSQLSHFLVKTTGSTISKARETLEHQTRY